MKCPRCGSPLKLEAWSGMELMLKCHNPVRGRCGMYRLVDDDWDWFHRRLNAFVDGLPQERLEEVKT